MPQAAGLLQRQPGGALDVAIVLTLPPGPSATHIILGRLWGQLP